MSISERVIAAIQRQPGLTDRELTNLVLGVERTQQSVNKACRSLAAKGMIVRIRREDGRLGNYSTDNAPAPVPRRDPAAHSCEPEWLSEDQVKEAVASWLRAQGWRIDTLKLGCNHGIDIVAVNNDKRWIIEAKGQGSRPEMRVNYFLSVLGEILQRMDDPAAKYSIALPETPQFRNLWARLPKIAKVRTGITAIFVSHSGTITHED
jgi:Holliday junction resolvase-like predicted endonuclease